MSAVVTALGTMAAIAAVGWLVARSGVLGEGAARVLAGTVFTVAAPALLLATIAHADLGLLMSRLAAVTVVSTLTVVLAAAAVLRLVWRRPAGETTVGALAASYVNAAYLGIPIAVYVLGDALAVVPTILFQLLVLAPVAFVVLEHRPDGEPDRTAAGVSRRGGAFRAALTRTARTPIVLAALLGVLLAAAPWDLPEVLYEPFRLVGAAAAPLALLAFGMSLAGHRTPGATRPVRELTLAVVMRTVVHPALTAAVGTAAGLGRAELLAVVTMAALPTAQNVLVYALQYGRGVALARDAAAITTTLALPVILVVTALLG